LIHRDVSRATAERYDLVVVGGGIYGVFLTMEAARRGFRPLLIERDDFGGGTSWSSLRILHGGLRYLQAADLRRFRESVSERRWFCRTFPDLVQPLECLMPLYGLGLRRPSVFRAAVALNDMLSYDRNSGVRADRRLGSGRVLDADDTLAKFPLADRDGLMGGGSWYDAAMTSTVRVLMETLRWACSNGATALNYVECMSLLREGDGTGGVEAVDRATGDLIELRAPIVVNCAGPSCRIVAGRLDRDHEPLFRPSLAFNLLLDHPPLSDAALALTPEPTSGSPTGRTYFLRSWRGRIFAGKFHAARDRYPVSPKPTDEEIEHFVADLDRAVPALELSTAAIVRVYSGLLPAARAATEDLASRELIVDHRATGGPSGLWSVSGVKYTTARLVAERTLRRIFAASDRDLAVRPGTERPEPAAIPSAGDPSPLLGGTSPELAGAVRRMVDEEAVTCLEDLVLRRTDWGADPKQAEAVTAALGRLLGDDLPAQPALRGSGVGADA
jgi:glycerol-3-phosphate dehydrogenase